MAHMALVQLIIARRGSSWALLRDGRQVGTYADINAAREVAGMIAEQVSLAGDECELLIHDTDWRDEPCEEAARPSM
jgi:hypothetical protein